MSQINCSHMFTVFHHFFFQTHACSAQRIFLFSIIPCSFYTLRHICHSKSVLKIPTCKIKPIQIFVTKDMVYRGCLYFFYIFELLNFTSGPCWLSRLFDCILPERSLKISSAYKKEKFQENSKRYLSNSNLRCPKL